MRVRTGFVLFVVALLMCSQSIEAKDYAAIHKKGYCVWYGECKSPFNCLYNGPAKTLNNTMAMERLQRLCPAIAAQGGNTCCDSKQIEVLELNLNATLRELTSHCPACWQNMLDMYCQLTCSPDQSLFLDPETVLGFPPYLPYMITKINYYISSKFKNGLFDSCKNVNFPGNVIKILNVSIFPGSHDKILTLLCDQHVDRCTPQKLLENMGRNSAGGLPAPFDIFYPEIIPANMSWMNITVYNCSENFIIPATNETSTRCSCQDCEGTCPTEQPLPSKLPPKQDGNSNIIGLDMPSFSFLVIYSILFTSFIPISLYVVIVGRRQYTHFENEPESNGEDNGTSLPDVISGDVITTPNGGEGTGSTFKCRSRVCLWWGHHPFLVISTCLIIVSIVSGGLYAVYKDPLKLWFFPGNSSDCPLNYPLYYKEQLIIGANSNYTQNRTAAGYYQYPVETFIPFGPVFYLDLLNQALDLQQYLTKMVVPCYGNGTAINITLDDICYKPHSPLNNQCSIQSVFQYFQNNKASLNRCITSMRYSCHRPHPPDFFYADFHDHILTCIRSPLSLNDKMLGGSCVGDDGVPINPNEVFGGFNGTADYHNASSLIITFDVDNNKDKIKHEMALAWEKAFVDYMNDYITDPKNSNLTIRWSSRRPAQHHCVPKHDPHKNNSNKSKVIVLALLHCINCCVVLVLYGTVVSLCIRKTSRKI